MLIARRASRGGCEATCDGKGAAATELLPLGAVASRELLLRLKERKLLPPGSETTL